MGRFRTGVRLVRRRQKLGAAVRVLAFRGSGGCSLGFGIFRVLARVSRRAARV